MAHTHSNLLCHAIWSTKNRQPFITKDIKVRLHGYLRRVVDDTGAKLLFINGMEDHVHLLFVMPLTLLIPDLIEKIKPAATKWVKKNFPTHQEFSWQKGYGVFSVGKSNLQQVINYIANQEEHHRKVTFEEEYIDFLKKQGIPYDVKLIFE